MDEFLEKIQGCVAPFIDEHFDEITELFETGSALFVIDGKKMLLSLTVDADV